MVADVVILACCLLVAYGLMSESYRCHLDGEWDWKWAWAVAALFPVLGALSTVGLAS